MVYRIKYCIFIGRPEGTLDYAYDWIRIYIHPVIKWLKMSLACISVYRPVE